VGSWLFTDVQKPLQTARLSSNCTQTNFPVLPCIGVLLVYQHTPRDIAGQELECWKEEACRKDTIIMSLTQHLRELEASPEPREDHITTSESTDK
jgi:hypothetical protein